MDYSIYSVLGKNIPDNILCTSALYEISVSFIAIMTHGTYYMTFIIFYLNNIVCTHFYL